VTIVKFIANLNVVKDLLKFKKKSIIISKIVRNISKNAKIAEFVINKIKYNNIIA